MAKYVYVFGADATEGSVEMLDLLGGKGANLADMARLGIPVPPGFTITTEVCRHFYGHDRQYPTELEAQVQQALAAVEKATGRRFGDPQHPLLVSIRSGARRSMPGMMETVLNVGLSGDTLPGLIADTGNGRFAYDAYRRLLMMYSDVVMEKAAGVESRGKGIRKLLDERLDRVKRERGYAADTELTEDELSGLVAEFKELIRATVGTPFPDDPWEQLWGAIGAVFASWMGKRAVEYRRIERIPDTWGTAVNVQAMVFGNMGQDCATGVAFTRNPATGENAFYGEYLVNAQGEDVVAGIRTPAPLNAHSRNDQSRKLPTLEERMPAAYQEICAIREELELRYRDMQDIEFTIEKNRLYMLQCRTGKRTGVAAVRMAMEMLDEGLVDRRTAVLRVAALQLVELLLPMLDPKAEGKADLIATGLPAGPGGAVGRAVFTAEDAVNWAARGEKVILVREETSPEDVDGMHKAQAVLTSKGGMTSHAALVARGWGKCCIVGCGDIEIARDGRSFRTQGGVEVEEGDWISLNGTSGRVYVGALSLIPASPEGNPFYVRLMDLADEVRRLKVRTNADTPKDASQAITFGAEGIGLFRTEHMFYGEGGEAPLFLLRKMIMARTEAERRAALEELFPFMKKDIKATLVVMDGRPVTIRLLDPPLHEFVPHDQAKLAALGRELGASIQDVAKRAEALRENNPMLGHRGVRLGITYPEITEMQLRAVLEASAELLAGGRPAMPEIMVPVTSTKAELDHQRAIYERVRGEVQRKFGLDDIPCLYGTMIEIPRAALRADHIAQTAEFFSFGTNDLTQMTFGFSRDDIGSFLPEYVRVGILAADPFQTIDQEGVGELISLAVSRGRAARAGLKVGICGEHGGDPDSVEFCHRVGMDYVSCSPFRVPIARLAAAHAALREG